MGERDDLLAGVEGVVREAEAAVVEEKVVDNSLRVVRLAVENVKRLKCVSVTPEGNLVEVTGANGSGKTSTLNSIWWALAGKDVIQSVPIREGEERARIELDLGSLVVTRVFRRGVDGDYTTSVRVVDQDGAVMRGPQELLDRLAGPGGLAFDPLEFARARPRQQFDALKKFVPGIDFDKLDGLDLADREKRTELGRVLKNLEGASAAIVVPSGLPAEAVDESALLDEIGLVGEFNAGLQRQRDERRRKGDQIYASGLEAKGLRERAADLRAKAEEIDEQAKVLELWVAEAEKEALALPALADPKDGAEVRARLEQAKLVNRGLAEAARKAAALKRAEDASLQIAALTEKLRLREEERRKAIASAAMPVEGLGFGDGFVTLGGVPFEQASDAEQLRASIGIAMAANPRLRVVLVRDGSLLDSRSMKALAAAADAAGCQVWVEAVDESGEVGIVLEDGVVASTPQGRRARKAAEAKP